jgi:hypothetical protein
MNSNVRVSAAGGIGLPAAVWAGRPDAVAVSAAPLPVGANWLTYTSTGRARTFSAVATASFTFLDSL